MSYGFSGKAVRGYLESVSDNLSAAGESHSAHPFDGCEGGAVSPPALSYRTNKTTPHDPYSADAGDHASGIGTLGNIAVDRDAYGALSQKIAITDDQTGQTLYTIAQQILEMCSTIYVMPKATPKYLSILDSVTSSFEEFRAVTNETGSTARHFSDELAEIR